MSYGKELSLTQIRRNLYVAACKPYGKHQSLYDESLFNRTPKHKQGIVTGYMACASCGMRIKWNKKQAAVFGPVPKADTV